MKMKKSILAFLTATSLLVPALLFTACKDENSALPPTIETPVPPQENPENPENGNLATPPSTDGEINAPVITPVKKQAEYIRCTGSSVNFRSGAGATYPVIGSAKKNEIYALVGKTGNWYKTYYRGKEVYISADYVSVLSLTKTDERVEKVLDEGYTLLGVPYVYGAVRFHDGKGNKLGGFTTQKFDCSSLVQYVFYKGANAILDVTTRTQVKQGKFVKKSEIQRGDCIYFTNESRQHLSGVERVGHVAIYLGDNYILHTASDYARIEKMTSARWGFYIETRRFV